MVWLTKSNFLSVKLLLAVMMLFAFSGVASATLIGDTAILNHVHSGNLSNDPRFLGNVVVTEGTSDIVWFYNTYSVNMEANQILINTNISPTLTYWDTPWDVGGMNGLVVSDINDSSGGVLTGFTVDTNFSNWSNNRVFFDDSSISFDWQSLKWGPLVGYDSAFFNVTLQFGNNTAPVPEPSTLLLLGFGLLGIAGVYRKKN